MSDRNQNTLTTEDVAAIERIVSLLPGEKATLVDAYEYVRLAPKIAGLCSVYREAAIRLRNLETASGIKITALPAPPPPREHVQQNLVGKAKGDGVDALLPPFTQDPDETGRTRKKIDITAVAGAELIGQAIDWALDYRGVSVKVEWKSGQSGESARITAYRNEDSWSTTLYFKVREWAKVARRVRSVADQISRDADA